ncbi:Gp138 family membrane-puncturing spike protein [Pseudomonas sp. p1(2021b)]|uniref:Gp138 family membrane-puncturing spike protein n=1 Tax=Pseudomonas sp. p1(2021b) TaxID=2874628 RepID=UPI003D2A383C
MKDITLTDVIQTQIDNAMHDISGSYLAQVVRVNNESMRVDVQMLERRVDADGDTQDDTLILNVPFVTPGSSTHSITFPINVGDIVKCVVQDTNLEMYNTMSSNGVFLPQNATTNSRFDASQVVAVPFNDQIQKGQNYTLQHDANSLTLTANIGTGNECQVVLHTDGNISLKSPFTVQVEAKDISLKAENSVNIEAKSMSVNVPTTNWTGKNTIIGAWTFNGIPFDTHKHTGVMPGTGTSATPVA